MSNSAIQELSPVLRKDYDQILAAINQSVTESVADRVETLVDAAIEKWSGEQGPEASLARLASAASFSFDPDATKTGARFLLANAAACYAGGGLKRAADLAATWWGEGSEVHAALSSNIASDGGTLLPAPEQRRFIEELIPRVAVLKLGPVEVPMPEGSMEIPELTSGTTAQYVGENQAPAISAPKTGSRRMDGKELVTNVPISNKLIDRALNSRGVIQQIEQWVQTIAIRRQSLKKDLQFTRGIASEFGPKGLRWWALAENVIPANATVNFVNVLADLGKLISQLENADVPMTKLGTAMNPRTKNYLAFQALTGNDHPFFLEMISRGELLGTNLATTTQIPKNLGGGGDESEIIMADFDQVLLGTEMGIKVESTRHGSYTDNGVLKSTSETRETLLTLTESHDFRPEHDEAVAVLSAVKWGA